MRIKELSTRAAVLIPTIKYYLREGLLPKGESQGETKADYDEAHLTRLLLIRALVEVGKVSIAGIRGLLGAIDDTAITRVGLLEAALKARDPADPAPDAVDRTGADALIAAQGWRTPTDDAARDQLGEILAALRRFGLPADPAQLTPYLDAANAITDHQVGLLPPGEDRADFALNAVLSAALYERLLAALVRLAKEDRSIRDGG